MAQHPAGMDGGVASESLQQLTAVLRQQFETQARMMEQQLEQQRKHMHQQLESQKQQMERLFELIGAHLPNEPQKPHNMYIDGNQERHPCDIDTGAPADIEKQPTTVLVEEVLRQGGAGESPPVASKPQAAAADNASGAKAKLDQWTRCNGLHTVDTWVQNYRKHPGGWGALLMIHGIPEVTNRLRQKVQNYAIFSALFLAGSVKSMSGKLPVCTPEPDPATWECHIRKRVFSYCFSITIASHILCILLAMAFHNALNEAARDCDVYRMFARGKGFKSTMKCQMAFRVGALTCCIALTAVAQEHIGWDMVGWAIFLFVIVVFLYARTAGLLFSNASIIGYWREELGGKPDDDDPYDLQVPISCFRERADRDKQGWGDEHGGMQTASNNDTKRMALSRRGTTTSRFGAMLGMF